MSNEANGLIENHIEKKGITYPLAKTKGEDVDRLYGVKGFPSGALLDPDGEVVWMGHPASVPRGTIEELLGRTAFVPVTGVDDHAKLDKLIAGQEFGKALKALEKELEKAPEDAALAKAKADLEALLARKLERAKAAVEAHDYSVAVGVYAELQTLYKGVPAADEAKLLQKELEKDPAAKEELAAFKKMVKGDEAQLAGDFEKAAKVYEGIVDKYPDTRCAARAKAFLQRHPPGR